MNDADWILKEAVKAIPLMYRDRAIVELHARLLARAERHVQYDARTFHPLTAVDEELARVMQVLRGR